MINTYSEFGEDHHVELIYTNNIYWIEIMYYNGTIKPYFIVRFYDDNKNEKFIRLYINKPEYVVRDDMFTKNELDYLINLLNSNIEKNFGLIGDKFGNIHPIIFKGKLWDYIIQFWNDYYPEYWIDEDTPIPDYSKLETI